MFEADVWSIYPLVYVSSWKFDEDVVNSSHLASNILSLSQDTKLFVAEITT